MNQRLLYDGEENNFYESRHKVHVEGRSIQFKTIDFHRQYFKDLNKEIGDEFFSEIIRGGGFLRKEGPIEVYIGKNDMSLNYLLYKSDDDILYIIIAAFGESQPGRYKFYLEGIWKLV